MRTQFYVEMIRTFPNILGIFEIVIQTYRNVVEVGAPGARPSQEQQAECDRKDARSNHFLFAAVVVLEGFRWCVASDGVARCPLVCGPIGGFLVLEFDQYFGQSYCGPKHR